MALRQCPDGARCPSRKDGNALKLNCCTDVAQLRSCTVLRLGVDPTPKDTPRVRLKVLASRCVIEMPPECLTTRRSFVAEPRPNHAPGRPARGCAVQLGSLRPTKRLGAKSQTFWKLHARRRDDARRGNHRPINPWLLGQGCDNETRSSDSLATLCACANMVAKLTNLTSSSIGFFHEKIQGKPFLSGGAFWHFVRACAV